MRYEIDPITKGISWCDEIEYEDLESYSLVDYYLHWELTSEFSEWLEKTKGFKSWDSGFEYFEIEFNDLVDQRMFELTWIK